MARILVVGGAGFIGSHTAKALAAAGHTVMVFDNLSRGHREFVQWGPLHEGDIRDGNALDAAFNAHRVEAVMHFAALAYVGESVAEPSPYYDVNVVGTLSVLNAMRRARVGKIVFSSSCAVYGEPGSASITETTPTEPVNPYGQTKLICERMMRDFGAAYGIKSVCLRYFNAAGGSRELDIGEDHAPETHLVPLVLDAAMGRRPAISVFGSDYPTPDGTAIRDYIHVADLADAHVLALNHLLTGGDNTILNLGTGRGASVSEIIAAASVVTKRLVPVNVASRRTGDPARLVADASRARDILGWTAKRSELPIILSDAWEWHRRRFGIASARANLFR